MDKNKIIDTYTSGKLRTIMSGKNSSEELGLLRTIIEENDWTEEAEVIFEKKFEEYREKEVYPLTERIDNELIPFLAKFTIWDSFKDNKAIVDLINEIKRKDNLYTFRRHVYLTLMEFPRFKKLSDSEKLDIALMIGACDTRRICKDCEK